MRSIYLHGALCVALGLLISGFADAEMLLSHDAYVVRWQQDVMPITDASVLGMLVSNEQMGEIARDALELTDEQLENVSFKISCHTAQEITDYGATIQVGIVFEQRGEEKHRFTDEQQAKMRRQVLGAWEGNFSAAYRKATAARQIDWQTRMQFLRNKQAAAEERARRLSDEYSKAERSLKSREERSARLSELDRKLSEYRMRKDEISARRTALETQIKQREKNRATDAARERSKKIVEQLERALQLQEQRLEMLRQRAREAEAEQRAAVEEQIHEAESRVMEARIALEQVLREMAADDRGEAMLEEVRNVNVELMQLTHSIYVIEQRREEIAASDSDEADEISFADVKQARMEYELAERRLMRLNGELADLEDSSDHIVAPLTFIRLSD